MDPSEYDARTDIIGAVYETAGTQLSAAAIELIVNALADVPFDALKRAASRAVLEENFRPSPAKLRELAGVPQAPQRSLMAWEAVLHAIRKHGGHSAVDFDPITNAVIRTLGGWEWLTGLPAEQLHKFEARKFREHYERFAATGIPAQSELALPLEGMTEQQPLRIGGNRINGTRRDSPRLSDGRGGS